MKRIWNPWLRRSNTNTGAEWLDPSFIPNQRMGGDLLNRVIGIIGQLCLTLLPMYLVLRQKLPFLITIFILVLVILILKRTWWNGLED